MNEIKYPSAVTYYIAYTTTRDCVWGLVNPEEVMTTGKPNLYQTTNENEWKEELKKFYVVFGYQYFYIDDANSAKRQINNVYGEGTVTVYSANYNSPIFWYIIGYYPDVFAVGIYTSFQVLPD